MNSNQYSSMDIRTPNYSRRKAIKKISYRRSKERTSRRRNSRRRKVASILLVFMAITLIAIFSHQLASKLFPIRSVSITGLKRLSQEDVLGTLNIKIGNDSIFKASIPDIEKKLKKELSFVEDVSVSKKVIRGILEINLSEREVFAALAGRTENGVRYLLIDSQGILLEKCDNAEKLKNTVMIVGIRDLTPIEPGENLENESVNLALSVIEKSRLNGLYSKILTINPNNPNKISIQLKNGLDLFISEESIEEGLRNISLVLKDKKHNKLFYEDGDYLDARFKEVVYKGRS